MSKSIIQLERIKIIFDLIKTSPLTINNIISALQKYDIECSSRQIYRDLKHLELYYLRPNEQLSISIAEHNRKIYCIATESESVPLNARDIVAFQLTRAASPSYLMTNRADSMQKFRIVYKSFIKNNSTFYAFMQEHQNTRSNFHEAFYNSEYDQKIDSIVWAIANFKKIWIKDITGDATSISKKIKSKFLFKAVKLIYHRGNHFVAGYTASDDTFLILDISKVKSLEMTDRSFLYKDLFEKVENDLEKRFGVSQNIDNKTYDIILEISSNTGDFLRHYHWHSSQEFSKLPNENWELKMHCGINRELIGWISMWMTNIKIRKPILLKNLFIKQIDEMKLLNTNDKTLKYNNLFK